jgi:predicted Rossmann fold flavoprotein
MNYDLIIIGGGAAGIMAAISSKRNNPNLSVAIIDRTFALGRKILVCGAGRCNITNVNLDKSIEGHYYGASTDFIQSIFSQFSYKEILNFFDELGIGLYVERKTNIGKLFPVTDQAKTVTALLEDELDRLGVDVFLNTEVSEIKTKKINPKIQNNFEVNTQNLETKEFVIHNSSFVILSAGGKTYPALGSNGSGYHLVEKLGHNIIKPVPSALPVVSKNPLSQELQGTKLEIEVTSIIDGKELKTRTDDVMFTQYGLSGPAILNISREISIHINRENKSNVSIKLNFFPGKSYEEAMQFLKDRWSRRPNQSLEKSLFGIFPNKIPSAILKVLKLDKDLEVSKLSNQQIELLVKGLTGYIVPVNGTRGWNEAEFTAGGIDTKEVNEKTLESKIVPNLFFCGEILDVDGDVGGFNLSWAWSSGHVAGKLRMQNED